MTALPLSLTVNGSERTTTADPFVTLASVLRDNLGLTGTKIGCDAGDCGACTVRMNGEMVCACLVPSAQANGAAIETIEDGSSNKMQLFDAFERHGAAQCGICTPGMIAAATDLLQRIAAPSRCDVEDAIGGVLCRCTGYIKIIDAVMDAAAGATTAISTHTSAVGQSPQACGRQRQSSWCGVVWG
jgi:aldehyde oxidoreductase